MKTIFFVCALFFLFSGCVKNNPNPSWLNVSAWDLVENTDSQFDAGVLSHNISNAWVYMDGNLVGVFEAPFNIPVIAEGSHVFTFYPAIQINGISATKGIYTFMKSYEVTLDLEIDGTSDVNLVTEYKDNVKFWFEDFEDASFAIVDGPTSLASIVRSSEASIIDQDLNEGFFGKIELDETNYTYTGSTTANAGSLVMNLPKGKDCYLEIDYHNTANLTIGVLNITNDGAVIQNPMVTLNKQSSADVEWKKIYIDLREVVSGSTNTQYFEFSLNSLLTESSTATIYIDNIKAVYFP